MKKVKIYPQVRCPACNTLFAQERSNKKLCSPKCQNNFARKDRSEEYKKRNAQHYQLADRLTKTLATLTVDEYHHCIQTILKTAASGYSKLRNVLLDPKLIRQSGSVAIQVKVYCNTYLRDSTQNAIINSDRTYTKNNYLNRSIIPQLRRDYPTSMSKEDLRAFETLLGDLWTWEAKAKEQPTYVPRPRNQNATRTAPEIAHIEILDNCPRLPPIELIVYQDHALECDDLIDDEDNWGIEYQEYSFSKAAQANLFERTTMITLIYELRTFNTDNGSDKKSKFEIYLDDTSLGLVNSPTYDGARLLLKLGYNPEELLTTRQADSKYNSWNPQALWKWAKWTTEEADGRSVRAKSFREWERVGVLTRVSPFEDPTYQNSTNTDLCCTRPHCEAVA